MIMHRNDPVFEESDFVWCVDRDRIIAVMTMGDAVDGMIDAAFEEGAYVEALNLEDAALRQLFRIEKSVRKIIGDRCDAHERHIESCLTDLHQMSVRTLQDAVKTAQKKKDIGVRVNDSGVLLPGKSMCEIFLIAPGRKANKAEPCLDCDRMDCPYRDSE